MNRTTASTSSGTALTLADLKKTMEKLQGLPPAKWVLVAPDGRCWTGENPMQVAVKAVHGVEVKAELFDPFQSIFGEPPWLSGRVPTK